MTRQLLYSRQASPEIKRNIFKQELFIFSAYIINLTRDGMFFEAINSAFARKNISNMMGIRYFHFAPDLTRALSGVKSR